MKKFNEKINIDNFSIDNIDITYIDNVMNSLPKNHVMDLNIAEQGIIDTLHVQNFCQELIAKVDYYISVKDNERNKAFAIAALDKASAAQHTAAKNREWFAQADESYISVANEMAKAKAFKKWLENKASLFSNWHYAFKNFLKRDYVLEISANNTTSSSIKTSDNVVFAEDPFAGS